MDRQAKNNGESKIQNNMNNITQETRYETYSQQKRKTNVIMFSVPEACEINYQAAKNRDRTIIEQILSEILGTESQKILVKYFARLGKKSYSKCRPLLISFCNVDMKLKVMINAKKLAQSTKFSEIKIVRDKTPKERAAFRNLKDKIRARGELGLVTCGGKVTQSNRNKNIMVMKHEGAQEGPSYLGFLSTDLKGFISIF